MPPRRRDWPRAGGRSGRPPGSDSVARRPPERRRRLSTAGSWSSCLLQHWRTGRHQRHAAAHRRTTDAPGSGASRVSDLGSGRRRAPLPGGPGDVVGRALGQDMLLHGVLQLPVLEAGACERVPAVEPAVKGHGQADGHGHAGEDRSAYKYIDKTGMHKMQGDPATQVH